jgi:hypothetical protein
MLYECGLNGGSYLSHDVSCAGNPALGPVGYAYRTTAGNRRPIYSCQSSGGSFISGESQCDGTGTPVEFLGYSVAP